MTTMYRHVGKIVNTDARCVVVFMQIPGREDHALVVNTDTLPVHFEQQLRQVLESADGQAAHTLGEVLSRRLMQDTGIRILDALHRANLLQPVHVDNIIMCPRPSMAFPLRRVIESMDAEKATALPPQQDFSTEKFNPHLHNQQLRSIEERAAIARQMLQEATDLEASAALKRQQAYTMAPELNQRGAKAATDPWSVPVTTMPVVEDGEPVSPLMEAEPPQINKIEVTTKTASASDIERYAAQMLGEDVESVQAAKPRPAAKPTKPSKTTKPVKPAKPTTTKTPKKAG